MIGTDAISELGAAIRRTSKRPFPLVLLLAADDGDVSNADVARFARASIESRRAAAGNTSAAIAAAALRTRAAALGTMAPGAVTVNAPRCAAKPACPGQCGGCR